MNSRNVAFLRAVTYIKSVSVLLARVSARFPPTETHLIALANFSSDCGSTIYVSR